MAGAEARLVGDDEMARRPAPRKDRVAARRRQRRAKCEDTSVAHIGEAPAWTSAGVR